MLIKSLVILATLALALFATSTYSETFEERAQIAVNSIKNGRTDHPKPGMYTAIAKLASGDTAGGLALADGFYRNPSDAAMFLAMNGGYFMARFKDKMSPSQLTNARNFLQRDDYISADGNWWNKGTTENHRIMYASGHYLAAQENPSWARAAFVTEGSTRYMRTKGEWIFRYGVKEHDSPVYQTCHLNSWLSVATNAKDPQIKQLATIVAEVYLMDWAHEWLKGCWVASSLRAYSDLNLDHTNLAAGTGYLYFGATRTPSFADGYAALSSTSDYRVPEIIRSIATDRSTPYVYRSSDDQIPVTDGNHVSEGTRVNWPAGFRKYTYMDKDYGMYSQYDGNGTLGWSEQMLRWGVKWVGGHFTLKTRSGLGENATSQVVQYKGALAGVATAQLYRMEAGVSRKISSEGWEFLEAQPVYIAYYNASNNRGWAIETAPKTAHTTLEAFRDAVLRSASVNTAKVGNSDPSMSFTTSAGDVLEITFDNRGTAAFDGKSTDRRKINGSTVDYSTWPRMESPWVSAAVGDQTITLRYKGLERTYTVPEWTVSQGSTGAKPTQHGAIRALASVRATQQSSVYDLRGRSAIKPAVHSLQVYTNGNSTLINPAYLKGSSGIK